MIKKMTNLQNFIFEVINQYGSKEATEHSYRPALQALLQGLQNGVSAINEPKPIECGAPDFVIKRGDAVIGYLEAKDLNVDLRSLNKQNKEQIDRYLAALPRLIVTNCLDWQFYDKSSLVGSVSIGDIKQNQIRPDTKHYDKLEDLLKEFLTQPQIPILEPQELVKRLAGKASLIKLALIKLLKGNDKELIDQHKAFKDLLISSTTQEEFAEVYAETVVYGLFAARYYAPDDDSFDRQSAVNYLPKSNPLVRNLFIGIAGYDIDPGIKWIIDDLADTLKSCNLKSIMLGFGDEQELSDPFLHFYETFLSEYNPDKRKKRGVWYTPDSVVMFIVRAVDMVLRSEFNIQDGLADNSKINKELKDDTHRDYHRVQILDPAVGTGTFLAEAIRIIERRIQSTAPAAWSSYIEKELIPRLHGFEIMMAPYAICHMKLEMLLKELGYAPGADQKRLSIYLTDALADGLSTDPSLPFAQWLAKEAKEANSIKSNAPIMCVLGNPPYLGEAGESTGWIGNLMEDYKKEPGGKIKLKERNPKSLNDLYIQFMRMSEHLIDKNKQGILGFITNHNYLDSATSRGMRWRLLQTFDRIWILDLHGSAKKKERTPEGTKDENVFKIQQGVAIIIAVKLPNASKGLAEVWHGNLWGLRDHKYSKLKDVSLDDADLFVRIEPQAPGYQLVRRDLARMKEYEAGIELKEFMPVNSSGITTARDKLTIAESKDEMWQRVQDFAQIDPEVARAKYDLGIDVRDWRVRWAQADVAALEEQRLKRITYRLFDDRWTYYTEKSRGFICMPRQEVMRHLSKHGNIALILGRQGQVVGDMPWNLVFLSQDIVDHNIFYRGGGTTFPLYLLPENDEIDQSKRVNLDHRILNQLSNLATHHEHGVPDEWAVFDYMYGVLHCRSYHFAYAEFLKYDYPRIPWPATADEFWDVSRKGQRLRRLHLMESDEIKNAPACKYIGEGDGIVKKVQRPKGEGHVWINNEQFFENVPSAAWEFQIGGFYPAQNWLKGRKGRKLEFSDIQHYQNIIKTLVATDQIMETITLASIS